MTKSYCALLWEHQYVHTNGSFKYCCATNEKILDKKGNPYHINNTSFEEVWNSDHMKDTRVKMIKGEPIPACIKCVSQEEQGYDSMRKDHNKEIFFNATRDDGYVEHNPRSAEIHLGNVCNLKCKMCSQMYSNQIGKELLEMGDEDPEWLSWVQKESGNANNFTNNLNVEYKWFKNKKVANKLFKWISDNVTTLSVLGGEPTVIPEFWDMFAYCEQQGTLHEKEVTVVTNLTNVNPRLIDWLPKLKQWTIWASVDGIGERTEYIRYPSNWDKIVENLNFYKNLINKKPNGSIVFSPSISLLNIDQLDDMILWQIDFADGDWNNHYDLSWLAQVWYPKMLNYDVAPEDYRLKIADKLERSRKKFINMPKRFWTYYDGHISNLRNDKVNADERIHLLETFVKYNDRQDQFRGKKTWRKLIPDLEESITKFLS